MNYQHLFANHILTEKENAWIEAFVLHTGFTPLFTDLVTNSEEFKKMITNNMTHITESASDVVSILENKAFELFV